MFTCLFFVFCFVADPNVVVDQAGGYVPFTNSRVMPDGSLRPYDPMFDGQPTPNFYRKPLPQTYESSSPLPPPPQIHEVIQPRFHNNNWQWIDPNQAPQHLPDTTNMREPDMVPSTYTEPNVVHSPPPIYSGGDNCGSLPCGEDRALSPVRPLKRN